MQRDHTLAAEGGRCRGVQMGATDVDDAGLAAGRHVVVAARMAGEPCWAWSATPACPEQPGIAPPALAMNAKHAATTAETSERTSGFSMAPGLEETRI